MKQIKLKKGEKYWIEWNDTYTFQGWHDEDSIDERTVLNSFQSTIGFYVKGDKDWLILCMHLNLQDGFDTYGNVCWIPRGCVVDIKKLK